MIVHAPDGKENGIKLLPIAEVGAKDEFLGIKNMTRDDVLAAHRVPPSCSAWCRPMRADSAT